MRLKKTTYSLIAAILLSLSAFGQKPDALIDRNKILIGQQAVVTLSCAIDKSNPAKISFPNIQDTLVDKVEVVRKTAIDTLKTGENVGQTRLEQKLYITSFDSGYYAIPPFRFKVNGEEVETQAFLLSVKTVEIDTTAFIKGDRGIYQVDVSILDYLKAYWQYPVGAVGALALIALVIFLIKRYRKKEPVEAEPEEEKDLRPAHVIAKEELDRIAREKIFKRGKIKEYHTEITDVLRDYIERTFGIPAGEYTSHQILSNLKYSGIQEKEQQKLRRLLFRADMVKFAKETPDEHENTEALEDAKAFVDATTVEEEPEKPTESTRENE